MLKNRPANPGDLRDTGLIPGSGSSPRGGHGNLLQYSCLENTLDRGALRAVVHSVAESWAQLKQLNTHAYKTLLLAINQVTNHNTYSLMCICSCESIFFLSNCLLLLLLLSCFSRVRLCATPETAAHEAPPSWDSPGKNTGVGCHFLLQCMKVKSESEVAQSCLTLSDPMDCSLPGSSIYGIFQARVLEWGAIAFSN